MKLENYIYEIVSNVINEERGVFSEIQKIGYDLAKEFILKSRFYNQEKYKDVIYYSKYKIFSYKILIMTDSSTYFTINNGILTIAIDLSDIDENFYDTRNGVLSAMCHEFTHLLQTIYSKIKTNDENNRRFVTSYSMSYGGSELLYYFCYKEMQARIAEIFGYNNKDLESNDLAKRSIWCMRYMINSLKKEENIYEYMSKLSTQAKYGITMRLEKPDEISNDFPYLQNVTKENYMKKYQILINDLEKRMKWYVSRVYYWLDKIKNENPSLLKRNDDFGKNMERNIRTAKKISKTKQQQKKERKRNPSGSQI